jgi:hypothetical protein
LNQTRGRSEEELDDDDDGDAFFPEGVWSSFPFHAINTKCKQ